MNKDQKVMITKSVDDYPIVDRYVWCLNTPIEIFFELRKIQKPWNRILKDPENKELSKCKKVRDLIGMDSFRFFKSMGVGEKSYRQLMQALRDFGIRDFYNYPVCDFDLVRLSWQKKLIMDCRKEIAKID